VRAAGACHAVTFSIAVRAGGALRTVVFQLAVGTGVARRAEALHLAVRAGAALRAAVFQLPDRAKVALRAALFHPTMRAGGALRAVVFPLAVRAGAANRAAAFQLPVRAGATRRAVVFQPPVRAGAALHAVVFRLAVGTRVTVHALMFMPSVRTPLHFYNSRSVVPCRAHEFVVHAKKGVVALRFGTSEISRRSKKLFPTSHPRSSAAPHPRGSPPPMSAAAAARPACFRGRFRETHVSWNVTRVVRQTHVVSSVRIRAFDERTSGEFWSRRHADETRATDSSIVDRAERWFDWWYLAVDNENVHALRLLEKMPWASTLAIVSSMRAMHSPTVFLCVVELLIKNRTADGDLETREVFAGLTATGWAAKKGNARALERLLANGADANAVDFSGAAPLLHAVVVDSKTAVEVLLANGAHPDGTRGSEGDKNTSPAAASQKSASWTPLTFACRKGALPVVSLLLKAGADPDKCGGGAMAGQTPLIHAAMGGHVSVVQSLVKHAANPLKKDAANHSAIMHAGFRHPNDAALLAAIARAANEWEYRDR
jgi:hypothetical protein